MYYVNQQNGIHARKVIYMSFIPKTTCARCHRQYPSTRAACPYCGEKRSRDLNRSVPESDSAVRGTQANARSAENLNWQMIFGTIIVMAVLAAVIVIVSVGVNKDMSSASVQTPELAAAGEGQSVESVPGAAATAVPTATPVPTPVPTDSPRVTSVAITYLGNDQPGFTQRVGDKVQLDVAFYPLNNELTPEWSSSNENVATVDSTGLVTLVGEGNCVITVSVAGKTDTCDVISRPAA